MTATGRVPALIPNTLPKELVKRAGNRIKSPSNAAINKDAINQANRRIGMKELNENTSRAKEQITVV